MNEHDEKDMLYIPMGLKVRNEIFDGFGKEELFRSIITSIAAGVAVLLLYLMTGNVSICIVIMMSAIAGSVMMFTRDRTNLSVSDQIRNMVRFARIQKVYPYKYYDEWGG